MKKLTTEEFVLKSLEIHDSRYTYEKTKYKDCKNKVIVTCPNHGDFLQTPDSHINKKAGCLKCLGRLKTTEQFIKDAMKTHGDKYSYSETEYKNSREKVAITCKEHGEFRQAPYHHLAGRGCTECRNAINSKNKIDSPTGWTHTNWQKAAEKSKNFDSFKVYVIECTDLETNETFFKIGKTFTAVKRRYQSKKEIPYNYKVNKVYYFNNAKKCSEFEKALQNKYKKNSYIPKKKFPGMNECYSSLK